MIRKTFPPNLCRLCGQEKAQGLDVCSPTAKKSGLLLKINRRLAKEGVHIAIGDSLPKFICSECEVIIDNFTEFCKMVQQVQKHLEKEKINLEEISHKSDVPTLLQNEIKEQNFINTATESTPTVTVGPDGKVECKLCQNYLEAVEHTTLHMVTHGIGTVISSCRNCGHQGELAQFLRSSSGREEKTTIWCENCRFLPVTKVKENKKTKSKQSNSKTHHCEICSKAFRSKAHLSRHQIVHSGAKPFLCEVCGNGFSQKSSLKMHVLSHAGVNPYKCEQCGQAFRFKASLRSHIMSMHWHSGSTNSTSDESVLTCDHCGKLFATVYKLKRHYRMHTGERPYECEECGRLFSQSCNLNLHRKKHEGSKCVPETKLPSSNYSAVMDKNQLSDTVVKKSTTEQYSNSIIIAQQTSTIQPNPTSYAREASEVLNDCHDPKFLVEAILQDPVVPCRNLSVTETSLNTMDAVLLNTGEKNSDCTSQFVPLSSQFDVVQSAPHLNPEYLSSIATDTGNKSLQDKSDSDLFPPFSHDELLYIDQSSNLPTPTEMDNVVLPTFSSLQSSSASMSNISH